jgi:WD40 repeat protein
MSPGNELVKLSGHTDVVSEITFSPDGTQVATASDDSTVSVDATSAPAVVAQPSGIGLGVVFPMGNARDLRL